VRLGHKRLVRLLQADPQPAFDGILTGWPRLNGHYHLLNAKRVEGVDRTFDVGEVWLPRERVLFVQKL
jgi:hypothetical protein